MVAVDQIGTGVPNLKTISQLPTPHPLRNLLLAAVVAGGGAEIFGVINFIPDGYANHKVTSDAQKEVHQDTITEPFVGVGSPIQGGISGIFQVLPPQTSYISGVVPATPLTHHVSTPAVKETSPLAHPISFSPDMQAVFDLFLYTLSDADKLSLQAIHAAGTQLDTNDTALFTLVSQLVTPKGQEITYYEKWDAELTASMFDMIKNGESGTNILTILEIYETVTTDPNKIIQLQNFLNVAANGTYDSQTNTALNRGLTDSFDPTFRKLESIAYGIPSPVDTTALEVKAAMVATFDIPAPESVIPNMHPKSVATPQVLPVVSATAGTTPSTGVKTHGEGTMNIESAQPNVSGVEIVESLSKLPLDDYPLGSAFVLNPDGTPNFKRGPIQIADAEGNLDGNNNLQDGDVVFIKLSDAKGTFFAQVTVDKEGGYSHYVDQKIFETK